MWAAALLRAHSAKRLHLAQPLSSRGPIYYWRSVPLLHGLATRREPDAGARGTHWQAAGRPHCRLRRRRSAIPRPPPRTAACACMSCALPHTAPLDANSGAAPAPIWYTFYLPLCFCIFVSACSPGAQLCRRSAGCLFRECLRVCPAGSRSLIGISPSCVRPPASAWPTDSTRSRARALASARCTHARCRLRDGAPHRPAAQPAGRACRAAACLSERYWRRAHAPCCVWQAPLVAYLQQ